MYVAMRLAGLRNGCRTEAHFRRHDGVRALKWLEGVSAIFFHGAILGEDMCSKAMVEHTWFESAHAL
jgi:hypothetical protein